MTYSGRLLILHIENPANTYTAIAGLTDTTITINEQEVDITTKDSAGVRQLLAGNVLRSVSASGSGVFPDAAQVELLRVSALAGTHLNYRLLIPGDSTSGGYFQGAFRITSLEYTGQHDGAAMYSVSLSSAGTVAWTAAT